MNDYDELTLEEAHAIDERYQIGDIIEKKVVPKNFGRIAAQTAKQVVVQRIREAERNSIYDEFHARIGEIVTGVVSRISNGTIYVDINRTEGILSTREQVEGEEYSMNHRLKVYIMDVRKTGRGTQIFLSRSHPGLVKRLFELEVPEIREGIVEIRSISREAGSRTKMAVSADMPDVDAVGSCIGPRGTRVQAVVDELFGEKIDIIQWSDDPAELIRSALSPARVEEVFINEDEKSAAVVVPDYQLSLAIGMKGQNVRLAARLCGWKIDIRSHTQFEEAGGVAGIEEEFAEFTEASDTEEIFFEETDASEEFVFVEEDSEEDAADALYDGEEDGTENEAFADEADEAESEEDSGDDGIIFFVDDGDDE